MNNSTNHAATELQTLEMTIPDAVILPFKEQIIALCEAFGNSGQSGGSAPYVAKAITSAIDKLLLFKPVAPLTGKPDEFVEVAEGVYQNKRCGGVFLEAVNAELIPSYLDAIVFKEANEIGFTGTILTKEGENIPSKQRIKFPFTPKTFYVDVVEESGCYRIVNREQLEEALTYFKGE